MEISRKKIKGYKDASEERGKPERIIIIIIIKIKQKERRG